MFKPQDDLIVVHTRCEHDRIDRRRCAGAEIQFAEFYEDIVTGSNNLKKRRITVDGAQADTVALNIHIGKYEVEPRLEVEITRQIQR